jgi:cytochrome c-type biogenesis protein CcmH
MRCLLTALWLVAAPAWALSLEAPLPDPAQEARAKSLFHDIRCVVCQGESIADSRSDVAADLRREVRARVATGESDEGIRGLLVAQYGDGVLMTPRLSPKTWPLWGAPLFLLGIGALLARRYFKGAC